ncbi:MAG: four helix bundle protein [Hymenobacteraceae bacterium]|nr:four helix bundle protein [Hymenobacteraceae bacterium]
MSLFEQRVSKEAFIAPMRYQTKQLAVRAIRLFRKLPPTQEARVVGKQFLRSATSTGANYPAACRARSEAEYFAKLSITIEEADERSFWLKLLDEASILPAVRLKALHADFLEVVSILSKARKTTKA